jgi:hypothetical protein
VAAAAKLVVRGLLGAIMEYWSFGDLVEHIYNLLKDWQTLIAGVIAIYAAQITVAGVRGQTAQMNTQWERERLRDGQNRNRSAYSLSRALLVEIQDVTDAANNMQIQIAVRAKGQARLRFPGLQFQSYDLMDIRWSDLQPARHWLPRAAHQSQGNGDVL